MPPCIQSSSPLSDSTSAASSLPSTSSSSAVVSKRPRRRGGDGAVVSARCKNNNHSSIMPSNVLLWKERRRKQLCKLGKVLGPGSRASKFLELHNLCSFLHKSELVESLNHNLCHLSSLPLIDRIIYCILHTRQI